MEGARATVDSELPPDGGGALLPAAAGGVFLFASFVEVGVPLLPPLYVRGGSRAPSRGVRAAVGSAEIAGDCGEIAGRFAE